MESDKKKILIVDDDEVIRSLLENFCKFSGYEPILASDGKQALDLVISDCPDIIITDIHMPFMNGFQLLRAVKRMYPELPIIFITAFAHFRRFYADKTARADAFFEKPFSLEAIQQCFHMFL